MFPFFRCPVFRSPLNLSSFFFVHRAWSPFAWTTATRPVATWSCSCWPSAAASSINLIWPSQSLRKISFTIFVESGEEIWPSYDCPKRQLRTMKWQLSEKWVATFGIWISVIYLGKKKQERVRVDFTCLFLLTPPALAGWVTAWFHVCPLTL